MSVLAGIGVSLACALVWAVSAWWGRGSDQKRFIKAHLGGMALRLALAGGLSAWALLRLEVRPGIFVLSLLGSYTLLMIYEVFWLARQRRLMLPPKQPRTGSRPE